MIDLNSGLDQSGTLVLIWSASLHGTVAIRARLSIVVNH